MPFLNGFASKTVVMHAVQASGHDVAALLLTVTSIGTWLSVVLKVNWFVFLGEARTEFEVKEIPLSMKLGMLLGAAGCIIIGIVPSILYRLLPFAVSVHPFTVEHVLESLILFAGATIVFWLVRVKMLPHDQLSLDFDWLLRKPLAGVITATSTGLNKFTGWADVKSLGIVRFCGERLGNPYKWTESSRRSFVRNISFENEDRDIGIVIEISVSMLALITIIAMLFINK